MGGVDVCISNSEKYYLSILIRSAYFNKDKAPIVGIRNIVDEILKKLYKTDENINRIIEIKKRENLYKDEKILINEKLTDIENEKNNITTKLIKKAEDLDLKIEKHCRIKGNAYFSPYNELKRAELNSFINDNEIIKEIYKDKSEIKEHLNEIKK